MENATKLHNEFLEDLTNLINKFHQEHPTLFIDDIDIVSVDYPSGEKVVAGIRVKILVQPNTTAV
jgi:hypothetical protein